jgi:hypothetical protein
MLERYAALDPEMTDGILEKVQEAERRRDGRKLAASTDSGAPGKSH